MHELLLLEDWLRNRLSWLHIHDWETFAVFIFLGIFQIVVAIDSGYLAVLALPPEKKKKRHVWIFGVSALALLLLTMTVGWLNDKSQYQATQAANKTQGTLDRGFALLTEANDRLSRVEVYIAKGISTPAQSADIARQVGEARKLISQARAAMSTSQSQTPASPKNVPTQAPPAGPDSSLGLDQKIQTMIQRLRDDDATTGRNLSELSGSWVRHFSMIGKKPPDIPVDSDLWTQIVQNDQRRAERYQKQWLPQIQALRVEAQEELRMSPQQIAEDNRAFESLSKAASTPTPANLSGTGAFGAMKFDGVCDYLSRLAKQLPKGK